MTPERQREIHRIASRGKDERGVSPEGARMLAMILECLIAIDEMRAENEHLRAELARRGEHGTT